MLVLTDSRQSLNLLTVAAVGSQMVMAVQAMACAGGWDGWTLRQWFQVDPPKAREDFV